MKSATPAATLGQGPGWAPSTTLDRQTSGVSVSIVTPPRRPNRKERRRLAVLRRAALVVALAFALPARAECRTEGPDVVCPTPDFDRLMDALDAAEAREAIEKAGRERAERELAAARDRALVTCPPPELPVVPVVVAALAGVVVGVLVGLFGTR